jgi:hypothetical protein
MAQRAMGMPRLGSILSRFPTEAAIIGRIVIGYGELEISLMNCVHMARGGDLEVVLKTMFRTRGEAQRISIADALSRQIFIGFGLDAEFAKAISDMDYCRTIRNQYAHCIWHNDGSGRLGFVNLEELAKGNVFVANLIGVTTRHLDVPLLQEQETYQGNVERQITWLNFESRSRQGTGRQPFQTPPQLPRPDRYRP